jgi:AcrR family transcriptional regulator
MNEASAEPPGDRRIQRTRQTINEAFLHLILHKGFDDITIKDITDRANVNRTTFYAHYMDKYDLMDKMMEEKLGKLSALLREQLNNDEDVPADSETGDPYFIVLFEHIAENEQHYRIILTHSQSQSYLAQMNTVIRDSIYNRILQIGPEHKLLVPMDLLLDYMSTALLGIARKWLEQQTIYSPRYMALQLTRLSQVGTYQAMGLTVPGSRKG